MFKSDRDIALVYQGRQGSLAHEMLTVESYIKWYDIYAVSPEGKVRKLPSRFARRYERQHPGCVAWSDHIPRPEFCAWLVAEHPEFEWDEPSLDMIVGRWQRERLS